MPQVNKAFDEHTRIIQKAVMPMNAQFRIRCDLDWKRAIEDVARRRRIKFADMVRQMIGDEAVRWYRENKLPVPAALVDLKVNTEVERDQPSEPAAEPAKLTPTRKK